MEGRSAPYLIRCRKKTRQLACIFSLRLHAKPLRLSCAETTYHVVLFCGTLTAGSRLNWDTICTWFVRRTRAQWPPVHTETGPEDSVCARADQTVRINIRSADVESRWPAVECLRRSTREYGRRFTAEWQLQCKYYRASRCKDVRKILKRTLRCWYCFN